MRHVLVLAAFSLCVVACTTSEVIADAGPDAGVTDAGGQDGGVDAGEPDAGGTDAGIDDGGTDAGTDAGGIDAGDTDAGGTDAGGTDAGDTDAGNADAGVDAGPDAGTDAGGVATYLKASNTGPGDTFGNAIALSSDGSTLAVGAIGQVSASNGAGEVFVFVRVAGTWAQQARLVGSNTEFGDYFGYSVSLSADGSTLAVGAYLEDSSATGVGGDDTDNSANGAGAVYLFTRSGSDWSQQAYVKASNTDALDGFGYAVSLSGDGATLAVGALFESSSATGVDGDQSDNAADNAGAVYVFRNTAGTWAQEAYLKASNTDVNDGFGWALAVSGDGTTLAVGARSESSSATGIDGDEASNDAAGAGAVYVFTRSDTTWSQQAYVKASNTDSGDAFGTSVSLSGDGATLAVGATGEASASTGIDGDQADNSAFIAGAVYVFTRTAGAWSQQAYVKASNTDVLDGFGRSVALSDDGATLAVSAPNESSGATGIGGDQSDNSASGSGAAYVFGFASAAWSQQEYVKASNTGASDSFGNAVSLSGDGATLAVGAWFEDSSATGVDGDQSDNSAEDSGAVYVY
jgi:FG-GAP repeat